MKGHQFSLRTLLAAVAAVGIGATLWTAEHSWQLGAVQFLLVAWVLGSTVAISVHSTGKTKTFWIGVAAACIWPFAAYFPLAVLFSLDRTPHAGPVRGEGIINTFYWFQLFLFCMSDSFGPILLAWSFAPLVGLLCVFTHWLLIRPPEPKA